jgi:hypothetical protein
LQRKPANINPLAEENVIASEAKQSSLGNSKNWIASSQMLLAMTA